MFLDTLVEPSFLSSTPFTILNISTLSSHGMSKARVTWQKGMLEHQESREWSW